MAIARAALDAGSSAVAAERLNQVLMLPPNSHSQDAQELVGLARERAGETAKARAEYELYLRLFPDGEGAARVRGRLAALGTPDSPVAPRPDRAPVRAVSGTFSQYYYGGRTKVETAFNTPTTVDRSSFSATDQSSLVTNLDLTLRNRTESSDNRFVLRDTNSMSFLSSQNSSKPPQCRLLRLPGTGQFNHRPHRAADRAVGGIAEPVRRRHCRRRTYRAVAPERRGRSTRRVSRD